MSVKKESTTRTVFWLVSESAIFGRDNLIHEVSKCLIGEKDGFSIRVAEFTALIEGLNHALTLDPKPERITSFCNSFHEHKLMDTRWPAEQQKFEELVDQVSVLRNQFSHCETSLLKLEDDKDPAFKLAREALLLRNIDVSAKETCSICLEYTDPESMLGVFRCGHSYCRSCTVYHVEEEMLRVTIPKCPEPGFEFEVVAERCQNYLTPEKVENLEGRLLEASIPAADRMYCPYPLCSVPMSRSGFSIQPGEDPIRLQCIKCNQLFCGRCMHPWHQGMTCHENESSDSNIQAEELALASLVTRNKWRFCPNCNHLTGLSRGCPEVKCRCGFRFCYVCRAEWTEERHDYHVDVCEVGIDEYHERE